VLFGPGGVISVLIGAWGAWWAVARGAAAAPRVQWPILLAFAAAILAVSTWSSVTEPVSLVAEALGRRGDHRREALSHVPGAFSAAGRGLLVAWGALIAGAAASRLVDAPWRTFDADRAEQVLATGAAVAAGVAALFAAVLAPQLLDDDARTWIAARSTVQTVAWPTVLAAGVSLALAALTGVRRWLRDHR
jgi:hypothetical protein